MNYSLPWLGISTDVAEAQTASEAIEIAGLDWKVDLRHLYLTSDMGADGIPFIGNKVKNRYGVVRDIDNEVLGVVRGKYNPIQNRECFGFFDGLVEQGVAKYKNAGQLEGGTRIYIIAEMENDIVIRDNEKIRKYLFLQSSHDGTSSVKVQMGAFRLVCSNGLVIEIPGTVSKVRIQHSKQYRKGFIEARKVLGLSEIYYKALDHTINRLVNVSFTKDKMNSFVKQLFPGQLDKNNVPRLSKRTEHIREKVAELFVSGVESHSNSAWDAYNAVTEYVDHRRKSNVRKDNDSKEISFASTVFGSGAQIKQKAYNLLSAY